jgi:VanZ family protein
MRQLLLVLVLLILYGSFYPWHFVAVPGHPFLQPVSFADKRDFILNLWIYIPLGALAFWAFPGPGILRWIVPVCLGLALSTFVELVQSVVPTRVSSLADILANGLGTVVGMFLANWAQSAPLWLSRWALRRSREAFLLACWTAYLVFPLMPVHGLYGLLTNARAFQNNPFQGYALIVWTVSWVVVWELIPKAFVQDQFGNVSGLLLLLLPARLFLILRVLTKAEMAGALLAVCVTPLVRARRIPPWALATALLIAVAIRGLTPFEFSASPAHFSWIPFGAALASEWQPAALILISKLFWYGSAIWALDRCGLGLGWSGALLAVFLLALEMVQRYMPAHVPEITDPLLALGLAAAFWVTSRGKADIDQRSLAVVGDGGSSGDRNRL